ncbi:MAG TPA: transketolase C-terminal domain-containing protein [Candidatus Saccharibacteria bacterium]|nr:transketolase C-terminal domain-containing protein [Candidatus Saccharibacteria bacterium]
MAELHLADSTKDLQMDAIRAGFGRGLVRAGELNENVVAACADLTGSVKMDAFAKAFPSRYIQIGVAEQNLATVGAGLALAGKIPFVASYAAFSPGRNWEQIKTTACLNEIPVKIIGGHAGLYTGPDGATHQMLEDIALMTVMPGMVVLCPCDAVEAEKATLAMAKDARPNYLRMSRENTPVITTDKTPFEIGKAYVFEEGTDVTIIATGVMTYHALMAAEQLYKDGISAEVVHVPTIKPLDEKTILASVRKTGCVVTVEEAQIHGGLGGAVAELLGENQPVPMKRIGMQDHYGESGEGNELLTHFGLDAKHIRLAAHHVAGKK